MLKIPYLLVLVVTPDQAKPQYFSVFFMFMQGKAWVGSSNSPQTSDCHKFKQPIFVKVLALSITELEIIKAPRRISRHLKY